MNNWGAHKKHVQRILGILLITLFSASVLAQSNVHDQRTSNTPPPRYTPPQTTTTTDHRTGTTSRDRRNVTPPPRASSTIDHRTSLNQKIEAISDFKTWIIGAGKKGFVDAVVSQGESRASYYNLKNIDRERFLQYEKQSRGINLGWTNNAGSKTADQKSQWVFIPKSMPRRPSSPLRDQPIKYGERIAIAWVVPQGSNANQWNSKKKFIKYSRSRKYGINMDWSSSPVHEWTILGGAPGTKVDVGANTVVLYNLKTNQPLIFYPRSSGGHIGWANTKNNSYIPGRGTVVAIRSMPNANIWQGLMMDDAKSMARRR